MSDWQTRRDRHYNLMLEPNAELRGYIEAIGEAVDAGQIDAVKALAGIREKQIKTQAAIDAAWNELLGGAR